MSTTTLICNSHFFGGNSYRPSYSGSGTSPSLFKQRFTTQLIANAALTTGFLALTNYLQGNTANLLRDLIATGVLGAIAACLWEPQGATYGM